MVPNFVDGVKKMWNDIKLGYQYSYDFSEFLEGQSVDLPDVLNFRFRSDLSNRFHALDTLLDDATPFAACGVLANMMVRPYNYRDEAPSYSFITAVGRLVRGDVDRSHKVRPRNPLRNFLEGYRFRQFFDSLVKVTEDSDVTDDEITYNRAFQGDFMEAESRLDYNNPFLVFGLATYSVCHPIRTLNRQYRDNLARFRTLLRRRRQWSAEDLSSDLQPAQNS